MTIRKEYDLIVIYCIKTNNKAELRLFNFYDNIIVFLFSFTLVYQIRMSRKISRNGNHKYSNEEMFALGENENTRALIIIAQENERNNFESL